MSQDIQNKVKVEKLIQTMSTMKIEDYETRKPMNNFFVEIVDLVTRTNDLSMKRDGKPFLFTPKMLFESFKQNNAKYFADFLWTHSDNPKNLKLHPKNKIFFTSPRRCVYQLLVEKTTSITSKKVSEVKSS